MSEITEKSFVEKCPLTQTLNYKQNFEKKSVHEMNSKTLILGKLAFVPMGQKL